MFRNIFSGLSVVFLFLALVLFFACSDESVPTGTVMIDSSPDSIQAPWNLEGPKNEIGSGDRTLSECKCGRYTIIWEAVVGWSTPGRESGWLDDESVLNFVGIYIEEPQDKGSIIIDPDPDILEASWHLAGPGSFDFASAGDTVFTAMDPGDYTISWGVESGYVSPVPNPDTGTLLEGDTLLFSGIYSDEFLVDIPQMAEVPAGSFVMGDGESFCGTDQREVQLTRNFMMGIYEVTNQQYLQALSWAYQSGYVIASETSVKDGLDNSFQELLDLDDESCEIAFAPSYFYIRDAGHGVNPDHPVKEVTWYGAARFCDWLSLYQGLPRAYQYSEGVWTCNGGDPYGASGYRLPTDAEWEYAAQYDDERIYPWGEGLPECSLANFEECNDWTVPVGSCPDGVSALGFYDLAGNVMEWCNDWSQCALGASPAVDPTGPSNGDYKVLRGGSFFYADFAQELRNAARPRTYPTDSYHLYGFRVAQTAGQ